VLLIQSALNTVNGSNAATEIRFTPGATYVISNSSLVSSPLSLIARPIVPCDNPSRKFMDKMNIANLSRQQRVTDTVTIGIAGMTCDNCVRRVEKALRQLKGVTKVKVDRAAALARVTYDDSQVDVPAMHDALLKRGYKPVPATPP